MREKMPRLPKFVLAICRASDNASTGAMWGVAAGTTALWIVQPFDWIKKTFIEKPAEEK